MATWEDGPEYAPVQPPSEFAQPSVAPLEVAPPRVDIAAGAPLAQPRFDQPGVPVAPLASLVPPPPDLRDPHQPFEVVASTATDDSSAWSAAHYYTAPGADAPPMSAPLAPAAPATGYAPYAAPNTPQWFAPPPGSYPPVAPPLTASRLWNAASPGALITLLVGALVYPLSPITVAVAFGLSTRLTAARTWVLRSYGIAVAVLGFVGLIALFTGRYDAAEWWLVVGRWGQLVSVGLIIATLVIVGQTLRGRLGDHGRPPTTWG